jgi:hypothetical protein
MGKVAAQRNIVRSIVGPKVDNLACSAANGTWCMNFTYRSLSYEFSRPKILLHGESQTD